MTDEKLLQLIEKHGLTLGMKPPPRLRDNGDGTFGFYTPDELTIYGAKILAFGRDVADEALK